ncbi:hypothetical protein P5673_030738 [Acropora cervicornis]|uniref:Uncharacterized protein n=1 Tax=Acropora cervicornis TaxID=6130 RepID=A0AAD9PU01_ACRCE|nr:hypothetical protein P5673_030738 [Acropora cervicornis]
MASKGPLSWKRIDSKLERSLTLAVNGEFLRNSYYLLYERTAGDSVSNGRHYGPSEGHVAYLSRGTVGMNYCTTEKDWR